MMKAGSSGGTGREKRGGGGGGVGGKKQGRLAGKKEKRKGQKASGGEGSESVTVDGMPAVQRKSRQRLDKASAMHPVRWPSDDSAIDGQAWDHNRGMAQQSLPDDVEYADEIDEEWLGLCEAHHHYPPPHTPTR